MRRNTKTMYEWRKAYRDKEELIDAKPINEPPQVPLELNEFVRVYEGDIDRPIVI